MELLRLGRSDEVAAMKSGSPGCASQSQPEAQSNEIQTWFRWSPTAVLSLALFRSPLHDFMRDNNCAHTPIMASIFTVHLQRIPQCIPSVHQCVPHHRDLFGEQDLYRMCVHQWGLYSGLLSSNYFWIVENKIIFFAQFSWRVTGGVSELIQTPLIQSL